MQPQKGSKLEFVIVAVGVLVMMGDVAAAAALFIDDCAGLMGMFLWLLVPVVWLVGVLLPAGWLWLTSRLDRQAKVVLAWSTGLTVLTPLLATLMDHPISQHCIA